VLRSSTRSSLLFHGRRHARAETGKSNGSVTKSRRTKPRLQLFPRVYKATGWFSLMAHPTEVVNQETCMTWIRTPRFHVFFRPKTETHQQRESLLGQKVHRRCFVLAYCIVPTHPKQHNTTQHHETARHSKHQKAALSEQDRFARASHCVAAARALLSRGARAASAPESHVQKQQQPRPR